MPNSYAEVTLFDGYWLLLILMMFHYKSMVSSSYNHCHIYALENEMKLNKEKTKVMLFNTVCHRDFMPEISVDGKNLEVVWVGM